MSETDLPGETDYGFYSGVGHYLGLAVKNARLYEEKSRALEELRITQDKLIQSEKLAGLGAMAGHVVHEIGNPLAAIMNSAQVLQAHVKFDGRMKELMDIIEWESERLSRAIEVLREFSRPLKLKKRMCSMEEVIKKALLVLNQDIDLVWGKKITSKISSAAPDMLMDPEAMEQVVLNLLRNSLQAVQENGNVQIRVRSFRKKQAFLEVEDNGPGIDPENLEKIFEPYFSTKAGVWDWECILSSKLWKDIREPLRLTVHPAREPWSG
jgi:signal transduction histidine kinase